jgi:hypothetical protein
MNGRKLTAVCGNTKTPCLLHIVIYLGKTLNRSDLIKEDETDIEEYKLQIIHYKNDILFGYLSEQETIDKFKKIKDELNLTTNVYQLNFDVYMEIIDNKQKNTDIQNLQIQIYDYIQTIHNDIEKYNKTNKIEFVKDVIDLYEQKLIPHVNKLRELKYSICEINKIDNKYYLIQKPFTEDNFEVNVGDKFTVDTFQLGTIIKKTKKNTTQNKKTVKSNNKTKKNTTIQSEQEEEKKEKEEEEEEEE